VTGDDERQDTDSVDSLLREVAHAPGRSPRGSTLESAQPGPSAASRLEAGNVIAGRFRLERRLGEGGMGVVWQAVHVVTRKPVALKVLKHSSEGNTRAVQRFLREARAACAVRHPCVVEVHDVLELEDGSPVLVMELLAGETFAQLLARVGAMTLPELARIMVHVCSAVGCAHALGIVHRDLKPENIFLAESPSGREVKVLDFGIAKLTASEGDAAHTGATTGTGAILGTPYYMAPEQLFGERDVDHRADIWAIGIIFYEALAGQRPTRGDNVGQVYKVIMTDAIVPLRQRAPHLPEPVLELVDRMLSRDRTKRPADTNAVLAVLKEYTNEDFVAVAGPPVAAPPTDSVDPGDSRPASHTDVAYASTIEAAVQLNRSGVEVPSRMSLPPRGKGRRWAVVALVGVSLVGAGGVVMVRDRSPATPVTASPASSTPPAVASIAPVDSTPPVASESATASPSAVPSVRHGPAPSAQRPRQAASGGSAKPLPSGRIVIE
jgi:serine/threonine-protein kinase